MADIFLSYAREDRPRAKLLAEVLEDRGWSVWWDREIPAGATFDDVIEEAIEAATCIVVMWSETSTESRWVRTEAQEGLDRGILVPVLLDEGIEIPLAFRRVQAADLTGWDGSVADPPFERLAESVSACVGSPVQGELSGESRAGPKARVGDEERKLSHFDQSDATIDGRAGRTRGMTVVAVLSVAIGLFHTGVGVYLIAIQKDYAWLGVIMVLLFGILTVAGWGTLSMEPYARKLSLWAAPPMILFGLSVIFVDRGTNFSSSLFLAAVLCGYPTVLLVAFNKRSWKRAFIK